MWDHHMWGLLLSRLRTPHLLPQPHSLACWVESQISKSLNFAVCSKFVLCYFHIRDKTWHRLCITKPKCTAWRQGSRRGFSPFLPRVNIAARWPFCFYPESQHQLTEGLQVTAGRAALQSMEGKKENPFSRCFDLMDQSWEEAEVRSSNTCWCTIWGLRQAEKVASSIASVRPPI